MKKTSKALLLGLCALLLVGASVLGTMAYLTDTKSVENTFNVGKVEITLDEAKVDTTGKKVSPEVRQTSNEYHLFPGVTYDKDPTVHVKVGSEKCYVFVKVENEILNIEEKTNTNLKGETVESIAAQMGKNNWVAITEGSNVFVHKKSDGTLDIVDAKTEQQDLEVFNKFTVDKTQDGATLTPYKNAKIKVTAYAVQADGWSNTIDAETIWNTALKDLK